jgi:hypothetical protein
MNNVAFNEIMKLAAGYMSNLGVATMVAGYLGPLFAGAELGSPRSIGIAVLATFASFVFLLFGVWLASRIQP